ncbi:MAG TPA: proline--tRNA ligase [Candidatus Omnitrophota bacterium]|nr:proline--tRNA ligase [Candidatus Omnitrophota bacterium]
MRWSQFYIPTIKEIPIGTEAVSHQLLLRSGLVQMLTSGVYSYLPLGLRVLRKIEGIINEEMNAIGARELLLPSLQPMELWKRTGRDETLKDVMIQFKDKKGRAMCLGPTHEEVITDLVKNHVRSYKQLPVVLYQIQTKFRDEMRPRFGIVRACEFIMKDAYSFDQDEQGLRKNYELMYTAYQKIFSRCGLKIVIVEADSGAMGGDISHEYMVPAEIGEDEVLCCDACGHACGINKGKDGSGCPACQKGTLTKKSAIEIGHIFQLGTKYSKALDVSFLDEKGQKKTVVMGCYGIGVSRLIATIIEKNNDAAGIVWPKEVAPFEVEILPLQVGDGDMMRQADELYDGLVRHGVDVFMDDRDESPGKKFNDADLIGIPYRITLGKRMLAEGKAEIKDRRSGTVFAVELARVAEKLKEVLR